MDKYVQDLRDKLKSVKPRGGIEGIFDMLIGEKIVIYEYLLQIAPYVTTRDELYTEAESTLTLIQRHLQHAKAYGLDVSAYEKKVSSYLN